MLSNIPTVIYKRHRSPAKIMPSAGEGTFAYFCCRAKVRRLAGRNPPVLICPYSPKAFHPYNLPATLNYGVAAPCRPNFYPLKSLDQKAFRLRYKGRHDQKRLTVLGAVCWVLGVGCWVLDVGCWMLDAGCWMLDAGS